MAINKKTSPQPSTGTLPSTTNTAAPNPAKHTEKDILVGLYWKWDFGQLSQSYHKKIPSGEATLRKYKADLKQKEAAHKWQQKLCINPNHKIQAI